MENEKSIEWFTKNYPNEEIKYWVISDYLIQLLKEPLDTRNNHKHKLLDYIRKYTINTVGLDPLEGAKKLAMLSQNKKQYKENH